MPGPTADPAVPGCFISWIKSLGSCTPAWPANVLGSHAGREQCPSCQAAAADPCLLQLPLQPAAPPGSAPEQGHHPLLLWESWRTLLSPAPPALLALVPAWCVHTASHSITRHPSVTSTSQYTPVYLVVATSLASTLPSRHLLGGTLLLGHCAWKTQIAGG